MANPSQRIVVNAFNIKALEQPDAPALIFKDTTYSYAMLRDLVASFTLKFREAGVNEASSLQIRSTDLAISLAGTLAASRIGARVIERAIKPEFQTGFAISHVVSEAPDQGAWHNIVIDQGFSPDTFTRQIKDGVWQGSDPEPTSPWLILTTSGTTGTPKAFALSQDLVMRRSTSLQDEFSGEGNRMALLYSVGSRPFFARALGILCFGGALVENGSWAFWHQSKVTCVSGSLTQARKLIGGRGGSSTLPQIEVIGEKTTIQDIVDLLGRFDRVDDTFGAGEVSKSHSNVYAMDGSGNLVCDPRHCADQIEILDVAGNPCTPQQEGRLRVRSDLAIDTYLAEQSDTPVTVNGWFYTGDVARWTDQGALDVLSRENENMLTVQGSKIDARIIDTLIASFEGIRDAAVFASPKAGSNEMIAFAVFEEGENRIQLSERARLLCNETLGEKFVPARIWPIDTIPRGPSGTADREACKDLIRNATAAKEDGTDA